MIFLKKKADIKIFFKTDFHFFLIFSLLFFVFSSCTHQEEKTDSFSSSIKAEMQAMDEERKWTGEIDSNLLSSQVRGAEGISGQQEALPVNVYASGAEEMYPPLYPSVSGFASLDIRDYDDESLKIVQDFSNLILKGNDFYKEFGDEKIFLGIVLQKEIKTSFPDGFSSFILGKPFVNENTIQSPVRFFVNSSSTKKNNEALGEYEKEHLDVCIYLVKTDGKWVLDQMEFI